MHQMEYLRSSRLLAKIALPGKGIHAQHRFDWTGFVPELILDGAAVIGTQEQFDPNRWTSYGAGFCAEFQWPAEPVDGWSPKLGVGWLKSKQGKTEFEIAGDYEIQPSPMSCEKLSPDKMRFSFTLEPRGGYGADLTREVSLSEATMTIQTTLTNTGHKPIVEAMEYNHNFLSLNGQPIGPGYQLSLPLVAEWPELPENITRTNDTVRLTGPVTRPFFFATNHVHPTPGKMWSLCHENERYTLSETIDAAPCRVAVWGIEHVVSAEVFVPINLQPGESMTWQRTWTISEA